MPTCRPLPFGDATRVPGVKVWLSELTRRRPNTCLLSDLSGSHVSSCDPVVCVPTPKKKEANQSQLFFSPQCAADITAHSVAVEGNEGERRFLRRVVRPPARKVIAAVRGPDTP